MKKLILLCMLIVSIGALLNLVYFKKVIADDRDRIGIVVYYQQKANVNHSNEREEYLAKLIKDFDIKDITETAYNYDIDYSRTVSNKLAMQRVGQDNNVKYVIEIKIGDKIDKGVYKVVNTDYRIINVETGELLIDSLLKTEVRKGEGENEDAVNSALNDSAIAINYIFNKK